jgi:hypothetical protein
MKINNLAIQHMNPEDLDPHEVKDTPILAILLGSGDQKVRVESEDTTCCFQFHILLSV